MDGDITISDMSFKVTAYQPVVPCNPATDFCGLSALVLITGHTSANASFERVAFDGAAGPDWGFGLTTSMLVCCFKEWTGPISLSAVTSRCRAAGAGTAPRTCAPTGR